MAHTIIGNVDSEDRADADALWNLFTAVSAVGDELERARLTATGLPSALQCCFSGLVLVDENEASWTLVAQRDGHEMASARTEQICAELQPLFEVMSQRPVLLISAVRERTIATRFPECIENLGIRSLALAPLRTLRHRLGFVIAGKESLAGFSREEELILSRLAEHSAISVENVRLNKTLEQDSENLRKLVGERTQKLQRYTKRLEILQEIDRTVLAADSPQAISQAAMLHIRELVSCLRASVGLFDYEAGESIVQAINVRGETKLGLGASFPIQAFDPDELRRGGVQMVADAGSLLDKSSYKDLNAEGVHSWFSVPHRRSSLNLAVLSHD